MEAELEVELQEQLEEQQAALVGVQELLGADPSSDETAELLAELEAGIAETESALLGLKRQRLLAELDALGESGAVADGVQPQQDQQQQQQQQQDQEQQELDSRGGAGGASAGAWEPGRLCVFRHTDGRHYYGRMLGSGSGSSVQLEFVHPTRAFQCDPLTLPAASLHPAPSAGLQLQADSLHAGARVLVQLPGQRLWEAAELADVDLPAQRVAAVTLAGGQRWVLPLAAVVLSPHAPDPHGGEGVGRNRGGCSKQAEGSDSGSLSARSGSEGEEEEEEEEGEEGFEEEEEEEAAEGYGTASFCRVSYALTEAAGLMQQQAAAGPQSCTNVFFGSEAHSRGIGSKLMARMGFKGLGHGLGRSQQGMQQALQAAPMKRGAGLGVDCGGGAKEGSKKRRRGGKQRRRAQAAQAGAQAREAERQAQHELELKTGSEGMFAVLNSIIGDSGQAQKVKEERLGMGRSGSGGTSRQGHLFGGGGQKPAPKEEDRRALAKRADNLVQLKQKVQQLSEMAGRNARDKVMLPQIRRALAEAEAQVAAAERDHAASHKAIHEKEKQKRMSKF